MNQFPELQGILNNVVTAMQVLGIALVPVSLCIIALLYWTSFGNEHKRALAIAATSAFLIGLFLLMAVPTLTTILTRIFPMTPITAPATPATK